LRSLSVAAATALTAAAALTSCSNTTAVAASAAKVPTLTPQTSGTTNRLQAISPVSPLVAWASGVGGTWALTTDGGETWRTGTVPGGEALQFRDVEGVSDRVAYLMSAGNGADSRIYKTEDGGATWQLQFQNEDPLAFYDCIAFWNHKRGIAMSDAVNGRFPMLRTTDGETWEDVGDQLPSGQKGEAAFAASGTCVTVQGGNRAWIGTGGAAQARILATTDGGDTWQAYATPIMQGTPSTGVVSVDFRDAHHGILGGGAIAEPTEFSDNVGRSSDGGRTWTLTTRTPFPGAVYGLTYVPGLGHRTVVATGPSGAAWSPDEGDTWTLLAGVADYWAVAFASPQAGWLVGTEGRILKIEF
jgi:photosystem II stability/assembly factor-like uncharacterized protein